MHPVLDGPRLKVRRAECQLEEVSRIEAIFSQSSRYKVIRAEFNPKTKQYIHRVLVDILPPAELGLLIGDLAHNLRSALDQLIYQLGYFNGASEEALTRTQFPVFLDGAPQGCQRSRLANGRFRNRCTAAGSHFNCRGREMIYPLNSTHKTAIERLQPYKRLGGGHNNPLWLLSEINNADKHRLLQVIGSRPTGYILSGGTASDFTRRTSLFGMLEDGAPVFEAPPEVDVYSAVIPAIAFREGCRAVQSRPVGVTLWRITNHVRDTIEKFAGEFPPASHQHTTNGKEVE